MENKKQLIIIPPMSEALKKLNEVLEGISADENVEISMIDDLKELSQFIATTGQCLILASNAKKCATFLQDNKIMLAKSHCKTILFTPKEIPAKTLVKFTKIGLTESILESLPPKTFLYKVKLLLRSIKTAKPQDDAEKIVKSLEAKAAGEELSEKETKEKAAAEENVIDMDSPKKKKAEESGETIDYANPLKGKVKPQEENLDTHWKSNRKKDLVSDETPEDENMTAESELASIDMYYRGKRKTNDNLVQEEEDDFGKLKTSTELEVEEEKKKRNSYSDVIEEGSMKQKRVEQEEAPLEDEEKKSLTELDLVAATKKAKKADVEEEQGLDLSMRLKREEAAPEKEPKTREKEVEDLGGYLKGKVSKVEETEAEPEMTEEAEYDNSGIDEEEREKDFDLNLEAADRKSKKKNDEEELDDNVHEGEVDKLDGNMIGDAGTVDKIRTRMNGSSDPSLQPKEEDDGELSLLNKKEKAKEEDDSDLDLDSLDIEAAKKEREEKEQKKAEDDEELDLRDPQTKLDLLPADKKREAVAAAEKEERERQTHSPIEKLKSEKEREASSPLEEEKGMALRSLNNEAPKAAKERNTHDGQVDKIDTFYRSGDSKKKEQNWDNLTEKNTSLELLPGKSKRPDGGTQAQDDKDLGETTIDYRKLKEEFDMMASGEAGAGFGAGRSQGDTTLRNNDDDGSFRVVEIDPKSLDFSIGIINAIYSKDIKAKQIFAMIADELVDTYHCYPVFYSYKLSDKKFTEVFNSFVEINGPRMSVEKKDFWNEYKKETALFEHFQTKSMTTWRCAEIVKNDEIWEDVELPTWADQELTTKNVELIFPYFDGIDRMGMAVVCFPDGLNPKTANGLLTVLEMARSLFLDTIQRYQVQPVREKEIEKTEAPKEEEKKNVLSFFGGLFGKKKTG